MSEGGRAGGPSHDPNGGLPPGHIGGASRRVRPPLQAARRERRPPTAAATDGRGSASSLPTAQKRSGAPGGRALPTTQEGRGGRASGRAEARPSEPVKNQPTCEDSCCRVYCGVRCAGLFTPNSFRGPTAHDPDRLGTGDATPADARKRIPPIGRGTPYTTREQAARPSETKRRRSHTWPRGSAALPSLPVYWFSSGGEATPPLVK